MQKIEKLYQALAVEPIVNGKTQWFLQGTEAVPVRDRDGVQKVSQAGKEKEEYPVFIRGMNAFPEVNGVRQILEELPREVTAKGVKYGVGTPARTKWAIVDMKPLSAKVG